MDASGSPQTLQEAVIKYADPKVCEDALVAARWPRGVVCPHCGSTKVRRLETQKRWECSVKHPKRQFSAKVGTIFEDSPIKLSKWFVAIWLIASAKNGISSYELGKAIGITQKSAWFVLHRIRLVMNRGKLAERTGSTRSTGQVVRWDGHEPDEGALARPFFFLCSLL